jgi:hypothetical protein
MVHPMPCAQAHRQILLPRVSIAIRRPECGETHMLFIVGVVIVVIVVYMMPRMWVPGGVNSADLGCMSERWLAEHRASRSS